MMTVRSTFRWYSKQLRNNVSHSTLVFIRIKTHTPTLFAVKKIAEDCLANLTESYCWELKYIKAIKEYFFETLFY
jgi:hypothetical protein